MDGKQMGKEAWTGAFRLPTDRKDQKQAKRRQRRREKRETKQEVKEES